MRPRTWDQKGPGPYNKIYYSFFINLFICLNFKCYPPSQLLLQKHPIPSSIFPLYFTSMRVLLYPLTHLKHTTIAFPYAGESSLHMKMGLPSHWCLVRWSSSTYVSGTMTLYIYTLSLMIFPLGALKDPASWYCCSYLIKSHSAPLLLPLAHPLWSTGQCVSACVFVKCL